MLPHNEHLGKLLLRLGIAGILLFHGMDKLIDPNGMDMPFLVIEKWGLPRPLAYTVLIGEVAAPLLLIAGLWARIAAWLIVADMIIVIVGAHPDLIFKVGEFGYALELPALLLSGALAVALLGAGKYSLDEWIIQRKSH